MAFRAGRSLIWALLESGGLSVLSLTVLFVVARILGPSDLGTVALALGIVQTLAIVVDTLLHDAIVQRPDLEDDHLHTAFWTCLGLGLIFSATCWFTAPLMGRLFDSPGLAPLLSVAGLSLAFSGAGSIPIAILRRKFMFKPLALRTLYGRLAGAIAAIVLAVLGYGVWSLIAQHLIQAAMNTAFVWRSSPWRPVAVFHGRRLTELMSFGIMTLGTRVAWLSSARLFTILVGYFLGVTAVGYINIAQRVVDTLHDMLAGAAYNLALPIFSRQQADRTVLARTYRQATEFAALTVQPMFAGVAICAPAIVHLFLGESWTAAIPLVQIMAIGAMLQFVLLFADAAVTALGKPGYVFAYATLSLAFVVASFVLFPPADPFHAAAIWAVRVVIVAPFLLGMVHRLLGRAATIQFFKVLLAPLMATAAMVGVIAVVNAEFLAGRSPLHLLLIQIPLGAAVYVLVMALIGRDALKRFLAFVIAGIRGSGSSGASQATIDAMKATAPCISSSSPASIP
jgi:O-antigen/teichoic acid export membrane protein